VISCRSLTHHLNHLCAERPGAPTADPKKDPRALLFAHAKAGELLDMPDLIIDRAVLESMLHARHARRVQIIKGLKPALLGRALAGERRRRRDRSAVGGRKRCRLRFRRVRRSLRYSDYVSWGYNALRSGLQIRTRHRRNA
jgi:hypothetical protein